MKKIVVGIIDSVDIIHNMFDTYIDFYNNKCDPKIEIKHFYKPKEAVKFIVQHTDVICILFSEVIFKTGENFIEALSTIRKHAPELPIYLLSVPETSDFLDLCLKYNVELMIKPLEKDEVITRVISAIKCSNER